MSTVQRTWSKYKSSIDGPIKTRMDLYKTAPTVNRYLYGILKDIRGEGNYDDKFNGGIDIKISFDLEEYNSSHVNVWFPLDISSSQFIDTYGSLDSIRARMADNEFKINIVLKYKPPNVASGIAHIDSDIGHVYNNDHDFDAFSLSALINGMPAPKTSIKRVLKPIGNSRFKSAIEIADGHIKIASSGKDFIELNENGITLAAKSINMQCSPNQIKYGGIVSPQSIFLGLIPSTNFFPVPQYNINLPVEGITLMKDIVEIFSSIIGT